jgi:NADPH:quinone reductase
VRIPGYSPHIPGLEFAGEVVEAGDAAEGLMAGDRVFGITAGEAQAEYLLTDHSLVAKVPDVLNFVDAAAIPEAFITAHDAVFTQAGLKAGETLLIHAVGSGVGLAAVQLAKAAGARTVGTSRTAEKLERARGLGLDQAILAGESPEFVQILRSKNIAGVDVVLDLVGGAYFPENLRALNQKGRLMLVGLTAGRTAEIDLATALSKRLHIIGTVLRGRSAEEKADATRRFAEEVLPLFETGELKTTVDKVFPLGRMREAHEYLESNMSFGKVVLEM